MTEAMSAMVNHDDDHERHGLLKRNEHEHLQLSRTPTKDISQQRNFTMKNLFAQVDSNSHDALKAFLHYGKQRVLTNREWCGLTISDFATFYVEMHGGKLVDSLVKFTLTANCETSNTLLSLMGYQEFAKDALDEWLDDNADTIVKHFEQEVKEYEMELAVTAAGF